MIQGLNDSEQEIESLTQWIVQNLGPDVPLHFTAFHPAWKIDLPPTPLATLQKAREIGIQNGLRYVYTGNVDHPEGEATYCHACGKKLIGRNGFELSDWNLKEGKCVFCGNACAGIFESKPGTWGSKRLPVRIHP